MYIFEAIKNKDELKCIITFSRSLKNDPNICNEMGETLLMAACREGLVSFAEILIEHGADVNTVDGQGQTAIYLATLYQRFDCVDLLLSSGAYKEDKEQVTHTRPLYLAILTNNMDRAKRLIDRGADINFANVRDGDWTLLHYAIWQDRGREVVARLIDLGCNMDAQTVPRSWTPVWMSISNTPILKLLLSNGANPNIADQYGTTALHRAATKGDFAEVALLIDAGADVNKKNRRANTPLHEAYECGDPASIGCIKSAGGVL